MWTLQLETRRRYVHGMTCLSVWYVRQLLAQGAIEPAGVVDALCRRVNLYRLTDLWDERGHQADAADGRTDPRWQPLVEQIARWLQGSPAQDTSQLEQQTLKLLGALLELRLPKDVGPPPVRPFACWTYELGWAGLASGPGVLGKLRNPEHMAALFRSKVGLPAAPSQHGVLHFMNVLVPASPLDDLPQLARSLLALIQELHARHPYVRELWCNTWLNDYPKFREIFPEAWFQNAKVASPSNFRNWWGQFARRDGGFNAGAAQRFRASGGVFPFRALQCHASVHAIEQHLQRRFP